MIFGFVPQVSGIAVGGFVTLLILVFQMLVGMRVIKFKGRTHQRVHRSTAWVLATVAVVHGFLGLLLATGWQIG